MFLSERMISLVGKIEDVINNNFTLLQQILEFLKIALNYEKLSEAASNSFTTLLINFTVQSQEDLQNINEMEIFLNQLFGAWYAKITNYTVL